MSTPTRLQTAPGLKFESLNWVAADPMPRDQEQSHRLHEPEHRITTIDPMTGFSLSRAKSTAPALGSTDCDPGGTGSNRASRPSPSAKPQSLQARHSAGDGWQIHPPFRVPGQGVSAPAAA